jgi:DNA (cytosine-5)-methyltransferase 1
MFKLFRIILIHNTIMDFKAISLFSGLGGDSLGMTQAGCKVIAYNELKPTFCKSHESNLPESELICDGKVNDILKLKDACFEKYNGNTDILFAGFPCQGYSSAGKKKDDDPRNTMFLEFLRAAKLTNPWMIIGENVKGLLTRKTTKGELYIDIIVSEFEKLNYEVIYQVLKTEQYNVPQKRERLIILGIKKDNPYGWNPSFPKPLSKDLNLKSIIKYDMTGAVRAQPEWFEDIPDECILTDMNDKTEYKDNNGGHPYLLSKIKANMIDMFYNGKQHENLFSFGKRDSPIHCEIIDIRYPSKTIICTYEHQPRLFVPLCNPSGYYLRMLLPDELKQIQGFPLDYNVCGTNKEKIIQIGNAVPPPLIRAIVEHVTKK